MSKKRLDILLVERGLVESPSLAQRLVMAGQVRVEGQVVLQSGMSLPDDAGIEIDYGAPFVSRGGEKLAAALQAFQINVSGLVCADVGASTGGFTDCLLQNGAARVYAIDVGKGILHWKLRQDERVVVIEDTNARYIEHLPEAVQLITIDASFISLKVLLPVIKNWLTTPGQVFTLVKPQFEARRAQAARGEGVIRDPAIHRQVLEEVLAAAQQQNFTVCGLERSPLIGPKGNLEFLAWLGWPASHPQITALPDLDQAIRASQDQSHPA
jgi:23S rRNA (cytidine1920-2'-O)/16S rRNA (cytidine1409-2'-O)-methyltransferase